jgi:hypothetical protein
MRISQPPRIREVEYTKDGKTYSSYEVVWNDSSNKRQRKRYTDREKAVLFSNEKHTELLNTGASHRLLSTVLPEAILREAESCVTRLAPKYSLTEAIDYFLKHFHAPDFTITVGEASVKYRGAMEGAIRDRTLVQLKSTLGMFERFTDNTNIHEVTAETVERFLNSLRARNGTDKASRKTWNNYRGDLHQFFEWCKERPQRYISANPASETKRFEIDGGHVEVLTVKQAQELMDYVTEFRDGRMVRYFALALFAGIRPAGELEKLADSPELVDLENKVIRITAAMAKTGKPRQIKIRPNLFKWLQRYPGPILPVNAVTDLGTIRKALRLSRDVLRHTFCSAHVMAFGSFADAAIESGNSEQIIRTNYLNAIPKSQAKAFWKIEPRP